MSRRRKRNVFRDGKVHVCQRMCATCIFRPDTAMELREGRLENLVNDAVKRDAAITCHSTIDGDNAVCRGFFDRHQTTPLQLAERMGMIEYVDPYENHHRRNDERN